MQNQNEQRKSTRVLLTGGGTGGHIFTLVAVARALREAAQKKDLDLRMFFVGPGNLARQTFQNENIPTKNLITGKLRRYFSIWTLFDLCKIPVGIAQSFFYVYWFMPDIIFSKGGYGGFFPSLAGWFFRIPVVVHESDASMGLANTFLSKLAKRVIISFPLEDINTRKSRIFGNPIRQELFSIDRDAGKRMLGIPQFSPVLLVLGGSQGAQKINELMLLALPHIIPHMHIVHQTGEAHYAGIKEYAERSLSPEVKRNYHPYSFMDEETLGAAYGACDLIVSRAGSGNIHEVAAAGKASILVPLSNSRGDHQSLNAKIYAASGAGIVLEEMNLTPHFLAGEIRMLMENAELRAQMEEAALVFAKPNAAYDIAGELLYILNL